MILYHRYYLSVMGNTNKYSGSTFHLHMKDAEKGDAIAQRSIGICYEYGQGVVRDEKKAFEWFLKAAEHGYVCAQNDVGVCYNKGFGVEKDEKKAMEWFLKAVEQGDELAQYNITLCHKKETDSAPISPDTPVSFTCSICFEPIKHRAGIVPCGHMSFCFRCISNITKCPICRRKIQSKIRMFG